MCMLSVFSSSTRIRTHTYLNSQRTFLNILDFFFSQIELVYFADIFFINIRFLRQSIFFTNSLRISSQNTFFFIILHHEVSFPSL